MHNITSIALIHMPISTEYRSRQRHTNHNTKQLQQKHKVNKLKITLSYIAFVSVDIHKIINSRIMGMI
jgi:hypothetical protein